MSRGVFALEPRAFQQHNHYDKSNRYVTNIMFELQQIA